MFNFSACNTMENRDDIIPDIDPALTSTESEYFQIERFLPAMSIAQAVIESGLVLYNYRNPLQAQSILKMLFSLSAILFNSYYYCKHFTSTPAKNSNDFISQMISTAYSVHSMHTMVVWDYRLLKGGQNIIEIMPQGIATLAGNAGKIILSNAYKNKDQKTIDKELYTTLTTLTYLPGVYCVLNNSIQRYINTWNEEWRGHYIKSLIATSFSLYEILFQDMKTVNNLTKNLNNLTVINFLDRVKTFYKNHKKATGTIALTSIFVPKLRRIVTSIIPTSSASILTALILFVSYNMNS